MDLTKKTCLVTGGSRGLGRGIVEALSAAHAHVVAVARNASTLAALAKETGAETAAADVTDDAAAGRLLDQHRPQLLVLCAGAQPVLGSFHDLSWEDFSRNWEVDAKSTFFWLRHVLRKPLAGAHVIVVSSGAAVRGSPVSGSYASAKRAQWFMTDYAREEARRSGLDIRFQCLLPMLNASTELGRAGIEAYAKRNNVTFDEYAKRFHPPLTPSIIGQAVVDMASTDRWPDPAYQIGGAGLTPLA
jgi:NAD(P)-dependent dehydrogenase (short-subunit alcohol dehydrogenase family)